MAELRLLEGVAPRALEFLILNASRTGEAIGARWSEIDLPGRLWTIPASRIKSGRDHRVPLSEPAAVILDPLWETRESAFVFPGQRGGRPLSSNTLLLVLRRLGRGNVTVHGFRSSFRTWAAEQTDFPREIAEAALAHVVGDRVEFAYQRSDFFQKRWQLAEAWAKFCLTPAPVGDVLLLRRAR
jgi:integrase